MCFPKACHNHTMNEAEANCEVQCDEAKTTMCIFAKLGTYHGLVIPTIMDLPAIPFQHRMIVGTSERSMRTGEFSLTRMLCSMKRAGRVSKRGESVKRKNYEERKLRYVEHN